MTPSLKKCIHIRGINDYLVIDQTADSKAHIKIHSCISGNKRHLPTNK